MELTTKGRYAVTAMADIARNGDGAAVPLSAIADRQALPIAYLEQLFASLRRAGLVDSARGRSGGYRLGRDASNISVADVMAAVEEDTRFTRCNGETPGCANGKPCITHGLWQALGDATSNFLASVSLADVARSSATPSGPVAATVTTSSPPPRVYLDYNATAPLRDEARTAMIAALDVVGNPSSVHQEGRAARAIVEGARESVARLLGAKPSEVVFTSGASEANSWVAAQPWTEIFTSAIEHDSLVSAVRANPAHHIMLPTAASGVVSVEDFAAHVLRSGPGERTLVSLQMANNETGVVQPVADVAAFARAHGVAVHSDAVQAVGRLPIDFSALGVDMMSVSAHKFGGPKGIGALVIRDGLDLVSLMKGGGQERRRRAGTENLAAIAGFGAAADAALRDLASVSRITALRNELEAAVTAAVPETITIGRDSPRLGNTSTLALPGHMAETLVIKLDLAGIAVSAGSACSSGKVGASHVLVAMGLDAAVSKSAVRVSLGPQSTSDDVARFVAVWRELAARSAIAA